MIVGEFIDDPVEEHPMIDEVTHCLTFLHEAGAT
jgi:hypothetical protein